MNHLFYLGIIIPTLITIILFVVFIYCWFLQKARKEVLTKKYDPHGKMRRLGLSMEPPPPPAYCRMDDSLLPEIGEDNVAYDVSRSPSTEQEARGRPMYHTYHDSGISAGLGLSPSQENGPRMGLAYRACPDSGISGFSAHHMEQQQQHNHQQQVAPSEVAVSPGFSHCNTVCQGAQGGGPSSSAHHICRGCGLADVQIQRQQHQPQQLYGDQIQIHYPQHHQPIQEFHQHSGPQANLHHHLVQASVHPSHGVCYGDDMTHPQSPQHYKPPPIHPSSIEFSLHNQHKQNTDLVSHIHDPPKYPGHTQSRLQFLPESPEHKAHQQGEQLCYNMNHFCAEHPPNIIPKPNTNHPHFTTEETNMGAMSTNNLGLKSPTRTPPSSSSVQFQASQQAAISSEHCCSHQCTHDSSPSSFSPTKPQRHSYRDSGVSDVGQSNSNSNSADRPDSQASQSSTTDSEDSGFRSSHCAAHHNSNLSKQANPLLKPMRRGKNNKAKTKSLRAASSADTPPNNGATPLITLNPQTLQGNLNGENVIHNTTLMELELAHRPPRGPLQNVGNHGTSSQDAAGKHSPLAPQALTFHDGSPIHSQHSPTRENWPPQSTNEQETAVKQNIDLNDISTHLSWKYLQDMSSGANVKPGLSLGNSGGGGQGVQMLQSCNQGGLGSGHIKQVNQDHHNMEIFGYSVV